MKQNSGFALIAVLMFMSVVLALVATYTLLTNTETRSLHASKDSFNGFNAAEAGLNLRSDEIRTKFINYNRPTGTSPANSEECADGSGGSGDFACEDFNLASDHIASTYVVENPGNPKSIVIPLGEPFAGLTASEYRYTVTSIGKKEEQTSKEADLELMFKTRLVPLFQFLLFFNDDMELVEGGNIQLDGPIHSNKDIYYAQQAAYWIPDPYSYFKGPVSAAGTMYRGAKFQTSCFGGSGGWSGGWNYDIFIHDLAAYRKLPTCSGNRFPMVQATHLQPFNGNVQQAVTPLTVPDVNTFKSFQLSDPDQPNTFTYWSRADVRFVLWLTAAGMPDTTKSATGIQVVDAAGNNISAATTALNDATTCPGIPRTGGGSGRSVGAKGNWAAPYNADGRLRLFRNYQWYSTLENYETTLDVDVRALLTCMGNNNGNFFTSGSLDETTDDGLVLYFAVKGPISDDAQNNYAVRFGNAAVLQATNAALPKPKGITLVTDQKAVVWGDYNGTDATWIPSAIMSDGLYILSNTWTDAKSTTTQSWTNRFTGTTILKQNFAVLAGAMPSCGGNGVTCEGSFNSFGGGYTGLFRFNETFYDGTSTGTTTYTQQPMYWKGSLVSLNAPNHDNTLCGPFNYFSSPSYEYAYDTRFNDPAKLPPLTPRAVYNRQELFERDYQ